MFDFQIKIIDTSEWKYFKVSKLFEFSKGKDSSPKNNNSGVVDGVKCIVAKNNNCGVGGLKLNPKFVWHKEALVIIGQGDGGAGLSYYVDPPFCANLCVWVLTPKDNVYFNKYVGLFLSTILSKYKNVFSHSKGINLKILNELTIKLPVNANGEPDWKFMEEYIKSLNNKINDYFFNELKNFKNEVINISKWKEFKLDDSNLFELYSSKNSLDKNKIKNIQERPKIFNYVTRADVNNGVSFKICKQDVILNKGHCLTIGLDTQTAFYQENDFYTGQNIQILRIKNNCSKYTYLFVASIIKLLIKSKFQWGGNGATLGRLKKLSIKLPIDPNGDPDWEYMDNYIKSLPYSKYI